MAATSVAFAAALGGAVYAAYLTWLEVAVIGAICQWCVVSAVLTVLLASLEGTLVWRFLTPTATEDAETGRARRRVCRSESRRKRDGWGWAAEGRGR